MFLKAKSHYYLHNFLFIASVYQKHIKNTPEKHITMKSLCLKINILNPLHHYIPSYSQLNGHQLRPDYLGFNG